MQRTEIDRLTATLLGLQINAALYREHVQSPWPLIWKRGRAQLAVGARTSLGNAIDALIELTEELGLPVSHQLATQLASVLNNVKFRLNGDHLLQEAWSVCKATIIELASPMFMRIPTHRAFAYENEGLFGGEVVAAFPAARFDIIQAGDCYACGHFTASVYHSVRALEAPLQWLAETYQAEPPKGKTQAKIIEAIEDALLLARKSAGTLKSADDIAFFSRAMLSFKNVKDAYRNSIAHDRPVYDEFGANRMMTSVAHFMMELAERVPVSPESDAAQEVGDAG